MLKKPINMKLMRMELDGVGVPENDTKYMNHLTSNVERQWSYMKRILILGGGDFQIPILEAAKQEKYYIILCDRNMNPKGKKYADRFYQIDTVDKNGVLRIARDEEIDGIISNSEPAMLTVAYVSEKLGLPGNSFDSISTLVSKDKFRTFQEKIGIYAPKHFSTDNFDSFITFAEKMEYPIIIKPVECSGSRGTSVISTYDVEKIREAFDINKNYSRNGLCSVEEYVEMPSLYVVDGDIFVHNGIVLWDGMFTSIRSKESPMIPMVQVFPIMLDEVKLNCVKDTLKKIFVELDIRHGEFNVEMYFDKSDRLFVIEINVRQGGNGIPFVIQKHCGIDMYKLLVTTTVGDDSYFEQVIGEEHFSRNISRYPVFSNDDGIYKGLYIDKQIEKYVDSVYEETELGSPIKRRKNAESVICFVDLIFDTQQEQKNICDNIEDFIYPKVGKND